MPLYSPAAAAVTDATIATTDITTNNASTTKHGWLLKLNNTAANFLNGQGAWATPTTGTPTFSGARAKSTANQAITTSTETSVTLDGTDTYDTDAFHDPVTNNSRMTIPVGKAGKYHIGGNIRWAGNATGQRFLHIKLNATTYIASLQHLANNNFQDMNISCDYVLAEGDYVELRVFQSSGGNLNLTHTAELSQEIWLHLIGT